MSAASGAKSKDSSRLRRSAKPEAARRDGPTQRETSMETLKTEKRAGEKVPYERPTLQKRERLEEVTEQPGPTVSGVNINM